MYFKRPRGPESILGFFYSSIKQLRSVVIDPGKTTRKPVPTKPVKFTGSYSIQGRRRRGWNNNRGSSKRTWFLLELINHVLMDSSRQVTKRTGSYRIRRFYEWTISHWHCGIGIVALAWALRQPGRLRYTIRLYSLRSDEGAGKPNSGKVVFRFFVVRSDFTSALRAGFSIHFIRRTGHESLIQGQLTPVRHFISGCDMRLFWGTDNPGKKRETYVWGRKIWLFSQLSLSCKSQ